MIERLDATTRAVRLLDGDHHRRDQLDGIVVGPRHDDRVAHIEAVIECVVDRRSLFAWLVEPAVPYRADIGLAVGCRVGHRVVGKPAVVAEVVPEALQVVPPAGALPVDGGCDEGYSYWWNGPARLASALERRREEGSEDLSVQQGLGSA